MIAALLGGVDLAATRIGDATRVRARDRHQVGGLVVVVVVGAREVGDAQVARQTGHLLLDARGVRLLARPRVDRHVGRLARESEARERRRAETRCGNRHRHRPDHRLDPCAHASVHCKRTTGP